MRRAKKTVCTLIAVILLCTTLITTVSAAGTQSAWLNVTQDPANDSTTALIVADIPVADGHLELTYDAAALTFDSVLVNDSYVVMYAVNSETAGTVKIAWIAPANISLEDSDWLFQVKFIGSAEDITMSAEMNTADGTPVPQGSNLDASGLEKAILEAEGLYEDDYTASSYNALEKALQNAREVMADPTATQSEVDEAAEAVNDAIASLELKQFTDNWDLYKAILRAQGLDETKYTEESWAVLEEALENAKAVKEDRDSTQREVDEATEALNDAMDALELKDESEPTEPEETEPEATEPEETEPDTDEPGQSGGGLFESIKKWFGNWFGKPEEPEPTEATEATEPEETEPEETEPEEDPDDGKGSWFDWIFKWFGGGN